MNTVDLYKEGLDTLYAQQSGLKRPTQNLLRLNREESLIRTLQPIVEGELRAGHVLNEDDLFALRIDFLKLTSLVRHIISSLG